MELTIAEIAGVFIIIGGLTFWFRKYLSAKFDAVEIRIDKLETDVKSMEKNYKAEFVTVNENSHTIKDTILRSASEDKQLILSKLDSLQAQLSGVATAVAEQKVICRTIQELKVK